MRKLIELPFSHRFAWSGGTSPKKRREVSTMEKDLITLFFREQCREYLSYWGQWIEDKPHVCRIFYNRARHDAHATMRYLGGNGVKCYYLTHNVGKVKYALSYHDGVQTHKDGSPFYGLYCFSNKKKLQTKINELHRAGYREGRHV